MTELSEFTAGDIMDIHGRLMYDGTNADITRAHVTRIEGNVLWAEPLEYNPKYGKTSIRLLINGDHGLDRFELVIP